MSNTDSQSNWDDHHHAIRVLKLMAPIIMRTLDSGVNRMQMVLLHILLWLTVMNNHSHDCTKTVHAIQKSSHVAIYLHAVYTKS